MLFEKTCGYCKKVFMTDRCDKKFCQRSHGVRYGQVKRCKERFRLNDQERGIIYD